MHSSRFTLYEKVDIITFAIHFDKFESGGIPMSNTRKDYSVPALEKTISILNALAINDNLSITEIHSKLNLPKSTTFVILSTLERHNYIAKTEDGKYQLGHGVFQLGMSFYRNINVRNIARPFLMKLVEGTPYTVHLAVLSQNKAVYIDKVEGSGFVRFSTFIGQTLPIHSSGVGKALAASLSESEIMNLVIEKSEINTGQDEKYTLEKLKEEIQFVLKHGYVVEDEQMEKGIRCIGAPIFNNTGQIIASISITSLSKDLDVVKFNSVGEKVRNCAYEISKNFGYYSEII